MFPQSIGDPPFRYLLSSDRRFCGPDNSLSSLAAGPGARLLQPLSSVITLHPFRLWSIAYLYTHRRAS